MLTLRDILAVKGSTVISIAPAATLDQAVSRLVEHHIGALMVCEPASGGERAVGIITERDMLYAHASGKGTFKELHVADVMTRTLIVGTREDTVDQVLGLMTVKRIRHFPVMEGDTLIGLVSIGDLVKAKMDELAVENRFLQDYIRR